MSDLHFEHSDSVTMTLYNEQGRRIVSMNADALRRGVDGLQQSIRGRCAELQRTIDSAQDDIGVLQQAMERLGDVCWPTAAELDAIERDDLNIKILGGLREPWRATIRAQLDAMSLDELRQAVHEHEDDIPF